MSTIGTIHLWQLINMAPRDGCAAKRSLSFDSLLRITNSDANFFSGWFLNKKRRAKLRYNLNNALGKRSI